MKGRVRKPFPRHVGEPTTGKSLVLFLEKRKSFQNLIASLPRSPHWAGSFFRPKFVIRRSARANASLSCDSLRFERFTLADASVTQLHSQPKCDNWPTVRVHPDQRGGVIFNGQWQTKAAPATPGIVVEGSLRPAPRSGELPDRFAHHSIVDVARRAS